MSKKIKFNSVINGHDLYEGFVKDGLLISAEKGLKNKSYLFIIGIEISYDTVNFREYEKFLIISLPDVLIHSEYEILFGNKSTDLVHQYDILRFKLQKIFEFKKLERIEIFKLLGIDITIKKETIVNRQYVDNLLER